jgi:hypothetical protein
MNTCRTGDHVLVDGDKSMVGEEVSWGPGEDNKQQEVVRRWYISATGTAAGHTAVLYSSRTTNSEHSDERGKREEAEREGRSTRARPINRWGNGHVREDRRRFQQVQHRGLANANSARHTHYVWQDDHIRLVAWGHEECNRE